VTFAFRASHRSAWDQAQERLLGHILGFAGVPQDPRGDAQEARQVTLRERMERSAIAFRDTLHEGLVGRIAIHAPAAPAPIAVRQNRPTPIAMPIANSPASAMTTAGPRKNQPSRRRLAPLVVHPRGGRAGVEGHGTGSCP
jgi:hypothetical protein